MSVKSEFVLKIAVFLTNSDELLLSVSKRLSLPVVTEYSDEYDFYLLKIEDRLNLLYCKKTEKKPMHITVDFLSGGVNYRREKGGGKNQPIARAVGLGKTSQLTVLDATAGLGGDAFVLASLGCEMILLERSAIIAELLSDGIRRALDDENVFPIVSRMKLIVSDAVEYMSRLSEQPDVVYLDPMYPERKKSAKVKKEMQILQVLLEHDESNNLLDQAMKVARRRVVVKRPKSAAFLNNQSPSHSIESKNTRFDVYLSEQD